MIEKNVKLWLGDGPLVSVRVSQFDTMWKFVFGILYKSQPWQIPTGATAVLNGKKPDGNVFAFSGTIADNKVAVDCDVQMTAVAGAVLCELSILSDGKVVGTANFIMDVEAAPKAPDDVSSESTLPAYGEILDRIAEMEGGVDDALSSTSENPVQNKVIKAALDGKANNADIHNLPSGGTAGQLLTKNSATDFDAEWKTPSGTGRFYVEDTSPSWHTLYFNPDYIQANVTPEVNTDNLNINGRYVSGSAYTEYQYLALPAPMKSLYFGGIGDRGGAYVSGVDKIRSVGVRYRIVFPDAQDNATTIKKVYMRYSLAGRIEAPQTNTGVPYDQVGARQALSIAQSYVDAQIGGRKFAYGKNWLYTRGDLLNNENGAGLMECDTFVALILRGIDYDNSPYALPTSTKTFNYDDLNLNPNNYPWVDRLCSVIYDNKYLHKDVRFASDISWLMWYLGGVFSDIKNAKPGDLVFWNKPESGQYFGYISHVGVLDFDENGTPWVYEVTSEGYSDGRVVQKVPFSQRRRDPCYFARIDYRTTGGGLPDDDDGDARTARPATLPSGGAVGQFLIKQSATDYDAAWVTVPNANGVSF